MQTVRHPIPRHFTRENSTTGRISTRERNRIVRDDTHTKHNLLTIVGETLSTFRTSKVDKRRVRVSRRTANSARRTFCCRPSRIAPPAVWWTLTPPNARHGGGPRLRIIGTSILLFTKVRLSFKFDTKQEAGGG